MNLHGKQFPAKRACSERTGPALWRTNGSVNFSRITVNQWENKPIIWKNRLIISKDRSIFSDNKLIIQDN